MSEISDFYLAAFNASFEAFIIVNSNWRILKWNTVAEDLYGYSYEDVLGRSLDFLETAKEWLAALQAAVGAGAREVVRHHRRRDGRELVVSLRIRQLAGGSLLLCVMERGRSRAEPDALDRDREALEASRAELRRLSGHLIRVQENERRRIARDLHDDICQRAAALTIEFELLLDELGSDSARSRAESMKRCLKGLVGDLRRFGHRLHPTILRRLGLSGALREFCFDMESRTQARIEWTSEGGEGAARLSPEISLGVFRIVQEAVHNAVRHGEASRIQVHLCWRGGEIWAAVRDDGRGFDPDSDASEGLGLISMAERARYLRGSLQVRSAPGQGTEIELRIPVVDPR